jgi:hypothetical protein
MDVGLLRMSRYNLQVDLVRTLWLHSNSLSSFEHMIELQLMNGAENRWERS